MLDGTDGTGSCCARKVLSDRRGPGVKAVLGELFSDGDDLGLEAGEILSASGAAGAIRGEAGLAFDAVARISL